MPTPENIKLQVRVNGGAPVTGPVAGGVVVEHGDTIVLSTMDTTGVSSFRYEIVDYPDEFSTPTGWTKSASGRSIFSTSPVPPPFDVDLDAAVFGNFVLRLIVNDGRRPGLDGRMQAAPDLVDSSLGLKLEKSGQVVRDVNLHETNQFDQELFSAGALKHNLRLLQGLVDGGLGQDGEVNTGANVGASGVGVFDGKVLAQLQFRRIVGIAPVVIEQNGQTVEISVTGGFDLSDSDPLPAGGAADPGTDEETARADHKHEAGTLATAISASATLGLAATDGDHVIVQNAFGSPITSFGANTGQRRFLVFLGSYTLQHGASSIVLQTGADIVTQVGDMLIAMGEGDSKWRCAYFRADGTPLAGSGGLTAPVDPDDNDKVAIAQDGDLTYDLIRDAQVASDAAITPSKLAQFFLTTLNERIVDGDLDLTTAPRLIVQNAGVDLAMRRRMNFVFPLVATDSAPNQRTNVTFDDAAYPLLDGTRAFTGNVTIEGLLISENIMRGSGSPDGVVEAAINTIFQRTDTVGVYRNTDGDTAWVQLEGIGGLTPPLDPADNGYAAFALDGDLDYRPIVLGDITPPANLAAVNTWSGLDLDEAGDERPPAAHTHTLAQLDPTGSTDGSVLVVSSGGSSVSADGPKLFAGSGAPSLSTTAGSIYQRTDNGTVYVNTDGSTTWVQLDTGVSLTPPVDPTDDGKVAFALGGDLDYRFLVLDDIDSTGIDAGSVLTADGSGNVEAGDVIVTAGESNPSGAAQTTHLYLDQTDGTIWVKRPSGTDWSEVAFLGTAAPPSINPLASVLGTGKSAALHDHTHKFGNGITALAGTDVTKTLVASGGLVTNLTGAASVTGFSSNNGQIVFLKSTAANTLVSGATLKTPGDQDLDFGSGAYAILFGQGNDSSASNNWDVGLYMPPSGVAARNHTHSFTLNEFNAWFNDSTTVDDSSSPRPPTAHGHPLSEITATGLDDGSVVVVDDDGVVATGPKLFSGTGAPSFTVGAGAIYQRTDNGTAYISKGGGTWELIGEGTGGGLTAPVDPTDDGKAAFALGGDLEYRQIAVTDFQAVTRTQVNNWVTDATFDSVGDPRPPTAHTHVLSAITNLDELDALRAVLFSGVAPRTGGSNFEATIPDGSILQFSRIKKVASGSSTALHQMEVEYWDGAAWQTVLTTPAQQFQLAVNAQELLAGQVVGNASPNLRVVTTGGNVGASESHATTLEVHYLGGNAAAQAAGLGGPESRVFSSTVTLENNSHTEVPAASGNVTITVDTTGAKLWATHTITIPPGHTTDLALTSLIQPVGGADILADYDPAEPFQLVLTWMGRAVLAVGSRLPELDQ